MDRTRIPNATWHVLWDILYWTPGIWKTNPERLRLFVEAVLFVARTGIAWPDLPREFGPWKSVYDRFRRWAKLGIWQRVFDALRPHSGSRSGPSALETGEAVAVDSTICKAHRTASGARGRGDEAIGASRGGFTTKTHAVVDAAGRALRLVITGGNVNDCTRFEQVMGDLRPDFVLADRGYDSSKIRAWLDERGIAAVIPSTRSRTVPIPHDRERYKARHVVENFFARLKDYCRIALRRDKILVSYSAFVHLVAAVLNVNGFKVSG